MDQTDNIFVGLSNNSEIKSAQNISTIAKDTSFIWGTINIVYTTKRMSWKEHLS